MGSSSKDTVIEVDHVHLLDASIGGVYIDIRDDKDEKEFKTSLRASVSQWRQQGMKKVWLALSYEAMNLLETAIKEGFCLVSNNPRSRLLKYRIPALPPKEEVLVAREKSGAFKGKGVMESPAGSYEELLRTHTTFVEGPASSEPGNPSKDIVIEVDHVDPLDASFHGNGQVFVEIKDEKDGNAFTTSLRASISQWRRQGKEYVWLKLPHELANLIEAAKNEGFSVSYAAPTYAILKLRIRTFSPFCLPSPSYFVNRKEEVPVPQEESGAYKGKGVMEPLAGTLEEVDNTKKASRIVEELLDILSQYKSAEFKGDGVPKFSEEGNDTNAASSSGVKDDAEFVGKGKELLAFDGLQGHIHETFLSMLKQTSDTEKQYSEIKAAQGNDTSAASNSGVNVEFARKLKELLASDNSKGFPHNEGMVKHISRVLVPAYLSLMQIKYQAKASSSETYKILTIVSIALFSVSVSSLTLGVLMKTWLEKHETTRSFLSCVSFVSIAFAIIPLVLMLLLDLNA